MMSLSPDENGDKEMRDAVRRREERSERGRKEGERSLWQNMSMIGALGWLIVTPTVFGVFLGRWLDGRFQSGIFFTGAMIVLGVTLGCYLAWQKVSKE